MPHFVKKPVNIQAWRSDPAEPLRLGLPDEIPIKQEAIRFKGHQISHPYWHVYDRLHSGWILFEPGDWIIKGIKGEFYPCKADVFEATYEPAD